MMTTMSVKKNRKIGVERDERRDRRCPSGPVAVVILFNHPSDCFQKFDFALTSADLVVAAIICRLSLLVRLSC